MRTSLKCKVCPFAFNELKISFNEYYILVESILALWRFRGTHEFVQAIWTNEKLNFAVSFVPCLAVAIHWISAVSFRRTTSTIS